MNNAEQFSIEWPAEPQFKQLGVPSFFLTLATKHENEPRLLFLNTAFESELEPSDDG